MGKDFILQENPSIEFLELYALVAVVLTWSMLISNIRVITWCDNHSVMHIVNDAFSHCEQCMKLVRLLTLNNIKFKRHVFVKYVHSRDNILADSFSRMDFSRFWRHASDDKEKYPDTISPAIWPVEKIWFAK